jgi:hypothetical protein
MSRDLERRTGKPPILRRATAGVVLIAAAALIIHLALGLIMAVFWGVIVLAAIVAVVWALKTIVW